jgi:hypothetical protein
MNSIPTTSKPRRIVGCSILPYAVDLQWGQIYFCLGKERRVSNWNGSEKWSDFGGAPKKNKLTGAYESPCECASREFHEETLGVLKLWDSEKIPRKSYHVITKALEEEMYTYKITVLLNDELSYVTYVKQIPWQADIPTRYRQTHDKLWKLMHANRSGIAVSEECVRLGLVHPAVSIRKDNCYTVNRDYMEKIQLRWWSMAQLTNAGLHPRGIISSKSNRSEILRASFRNRSLVILKEFPTPVLSSPAPSSFQPIDNRIYHNPRVKIDEKESDPPKQKLPSTLTNHVDDCHDRVCFGAAKCPNTSLQPSARDILTR